MGLNDWEGGRGILERGKGKKRGKKTARKGKKRAGMVRGFVRRLFSY